MSKYKLKAGLEVELDGEHSIQLSESSKTHVMFYDANERDAFLKGFCDKQAKPLKPKKLKPKKLKALLESGKYVQDLNGFKVSLDNTIDRELKWVSNGARLNVWQFLNIDWYAV